VTIRVSGGGKRGRISVEFFDLDHFDAIMSNMGYRPGADS